MYKINFLYLYHLLYFGESDGSLPFFCPKTLYMMMIKYIIGIRVTYFFLNYSDTMVMVEINTPALATLLSGVWRDWSIFFVILKLYPWGYTNFIDVNNFLALLFGVFDKLLFFFLLQMRPLINYYHTLYLMIHFGCSTFIRFKVYLANWKWSFGTSVCLKNWCLDLETGHSPLSLKNQFENQKISIPP